MTTEQRMIATYEQKAAERRLMDAKEQARLYRKAYRYQRAAWRLASVLPRFDGKHWGFCERGKQYAARAASLFEQAENV